jgi:parallel beta-helix repeat protein
MTTRPGLAVIRSLAVVLSALVVAGLAGCAPAAHDAGSGPRLVTVPGDAPTISKAVAEVAAGGIVLVSPGTYHESVTIDTADVTLRGTNRNTVIIDGQGLRANGIQVISSGVRVENLTVRNNTFNGILFTGMHDKNGPEAHGVQGYTHLDPKKYPPLQRFAVDHVTANDNGLYGIYAFDSQHGTITGNYASGSADSGFYVGQCARCDILVSGNVAERNAIGYENANASDSVVVTGNRFVGNRVGATLISSYQESYLPQKAVTFAGNLVADNDSSDSPAQASGSFGTGIGIAGGQQNRVENNRITGNPMTGVQLTNTEDIPAKDNRLTGNAFGGNGVDVANVAASRTPTIGTCVSGSAGVTTVPAALASASCPSGSAGSIDGDPSLLPQLTVPPGLSFLKIAVGPSQPNLGGDLRKRPARLPVTVKLPSSASIAVPGADLLADRAAVR